MFNIEQLEPCLRKDNSELIVGDIPTVTKQAAGREGGPAGFLVNVSKSNFNNLESALKKIKASIGVKMM